MCATIRRHSLSVPAEMVGWNLPSITFYRDQPITTWKLFSTGTVTPPRHKKNWQRKNRMFCVLKWVHASREWNKREKCNNRRFRWIVGKEAFAKFFVCHSVTLQGFRLMGWQRQKKYLNIDIRPILLSIHKKQNSYKLVVTDKGCQSDNIVFTFNATLPSNHVLHVDKSACLLDG